MDAGALGGGDLSRGESGPDEDLRPAAILGSSNSLCCREASRSDTIELAHAQRDLLSPSGHADLVDALVQVADVVDGPYLGWCQPEFAAGLTPGEVAPYRVDRDQPELGMLRRKSAVMVCAEARSVSGLIPGVAQELLDPLEGMLDLLYRVVRLVGHRRRYLRRLGSRGPILKCPMNVTQGLRQRLITSLHDPGQILMFTQWFLIMGALVFESPDGCDHTLPNLVLIEIPFHLLMKAGGDRPLLRFRSLGYGVVCW